jgi:class 3 adenylate cyclase
MSDDPNKPNVPDEPVLAANNFYNILKGYPATVVAANPIFASGNMIELSDLRGYLPYPDLEKVRSLEDEIRSLRDNFQKTAHDLQQEKTTTAEHKRRAEELAATLDKLRKKEQLAFLLDKVSPKAADVLLDSERLRAEFLGPDPHPRPLFAMSVDIRRSTDLMLKARTPQAFATFITGLCKDLMDVVRNNHGVVDKFTGDGILCFFPEFFSGKDSGYYALAAADECHGTFNKHYRAHRGSFQSVLKDVGLGIGIDYGECHLVQVAGNLTIVGAPVVYACRLGGAPAGKTLLNQPAYEAISKRHVGCVLLDETSIEIKHEGVLVAYAATLSRTNYDPAPPAWMDQERPPAAAPAARNPDNPSPGPDR